MSRRSTPTPSATRRVLDALAVPEMYRATEADLDARDAAPTRMVEEDPAPPVEDKRLVLPFDHAAYRLKSGRPSTFTQAQANAICRRLSEGELLMDICADDDMPSMGAVQNWRESHPHFASAYTRAREAQAVAVAERGVRVTREATPEQAQLARIQFDADRWLASKLLPRVFGERVEQHVTGEVVHMTEDQRLARIASLERKRIARGEGAASPPTIEGTAEDVSTKDGV